MAEGAFPAVEGDCTPEFKFGLASDGSPDTGEIDGSEGAITAPVFAVTSGVCARAIPRAQLKKPSATMVAPTRGKLRPKYEGRAHSEFQLTGLVSALSSRSGTTGAAIIGAAAQGAAAAAPCPAVAGGLIGGA